MVASKVSKTQNIKSKEEKKEKTPDESVREIVYNFKNREKKSKFLKNAKTKF